LLTFGAMIGITATRVERAFGCASPEDVGTGTRDTALYYEERAPRIYRAASMVASEKDLPRQVDANLGKDFKQRAAVLARTVGQMNSRTHAQSTIQVGKRCSPAGPYTVTSAKDQYDTATPTSTDKQTSAMPRLHHRPASDDRSNAVESASLTKPRTPQVKTSPRPAIPHPMDKVKFANGKADYHGATYTIVVHKQDASSVTGLVLKGSELEPPMIKAIKEGGCAAGNVKLSPSGVPSMQVGQLIIAVNGQKAYGHEQASALLRKASGDVAITLSMQASTASQPAAACEDAETASQVKTAEPSDVLYKASIEAKARSVNSLAVAAEAKARAEEAHAIAVEAKARAEAELEAAADDMSQEIDHLNEIEEYLARRVAQHKKTLDLSEAHPEMDEDEDNSDDVHSVGALPQAAHALPHELEACESDRFTGIDEPLIKKLVPAEYADINDHVEHVAPYIDAIDTYVGRFRSDLDEDGYDPDDGYGIEASRPPDWDDPNDEVAYPHGVEYHSDHSDQDGRYDDGYENDYECDPDYENCYADSYE
jgi:hypothetical protein